MYLWLCHIMYVKIKVWFKVGKVPRAYIYHLEMMRILTTRGPISVAGILTHTHVIIPLES